MKQTIGHVHKGVKSWPSLIRHAIKEREAETGENYRIVTLLPLRYSESAGHELTEALIVIEPERNVDEEF